MFSAFYNNVNLPRNSFKNTEQMIKLPLASALTHYYRSSDNTLLRQMPKVSLFKTSNHLTENSSEKHSYLIMPPQSNPRIIIVGAGAAGISAASRLIENGFANVKILEAEDRIGGRICTRNFGDGIIELGAQYCRKDGVVYNLVKDFNLLETIRVEAHVYNSKGERLEEGFVKILLDIAYDLYHHEKVENVTWKEHLQNQFEKEVKEHFADERDRSLARGNLDFIKKQLLLVTGSICLNGALGAVDGEYPTDLRLISNYQALLDILMKKHCKSKNAFQFDDKIMLKNAVTNIEWGDEGNVKVECANGSHYFADYVIITIPLGALKKQHKTLFSPSLPPRKLKAIESLGFGSILKVAFYFPTIWWTHNNYPFSWSEDDLNCALKSEYPWVTNCKGFYLPLNNPRVLMGWFVGNSLSQIESCTDGHLLDGAYYVLQKFLGKTFENITKPIKLERNAWYNNPYFGGVMCYETLESTSNGITGETLGEVVVSKTGSPQLLFAGEATNKTEYQSVESAVRSGFREADRIINICK